MDFLSILLAYATKHDIDESVVYMRHEAYCQNLYWQPDGEELIKRYSCDISETEREITRVRSGRY